ncbi:hypothetical protein QAD02_023477 [Eretmocerus hayati]|uniref:Uncharacterized protein n=1 Tax=Eretmocerus hayati TaxID=131215 RepID=A0ACC2PW15_9HYME|nr:hypothetical protein QAD02_023477 [Eretmocerus hayati]
MWYHLLFVILTIISDYHRVTAIVNNRQPYNSHRSQQPAPVNNPSIVSIEVKGNHRCGGSIISPSYLLTSAQCVSDYQNKTDILKIRANTTIKESGGLEYQVEKVIVHSDYGYTDNLNPVNDIAAVKVKKTFDMKVLQPIKILDRESRLSLNAFGFISGYGLTENGTSLELNKVGIPLIDNENCNDIYEEFGGLQDGQICAGYLRGGRGFCKGDEGGPLVVNGWLTGIASWSIGCGSSWPAIYTKISYYWDWIYELDE